MQILVLGMHRSGTSAVSRLINMMGASLGPAELVGRPARDNTKGFWERTDVRDINDALLAGCGARWDSPIGFDPERIDPAIRHTLDARIEGTVFGLDALRPWVLKDPRLCLTFPVWRPRLEAPVCVIPLRHPDEVARSLQERNQMPRALALALWEHYTLSALRAAQGIPLVWIEFSRLVAQPVEAAHALFADLLRVGCTGLRLPNDREIRAFVDPELRHHAVLEQGSPHPAIDLFRSLIAEDPDARAGRLPVAAESEELLAWHASQQAELDARAVQATQGQEAAQRTAAELETAVQRERERAAQHEQQHQRERQRVNELERTAGHLRNALQDAESKQWAAVLGRIGALEEQMRALSLDMHESPGLRRMGSAAHEQRLEEMASELARVQQYVRDLTHADELRHGLETSQRRAAVSLLAGAHEQQSADLQQLARWLDSALQLMRASFDSARWRIGDRIVRVVERVLLRPRARLARDFIEQTERNFREWRQERVDHRTLVQRLHAQLLESTPASLWRLPGAAPASLARDLAAAVADLPRGLEVPPRGDPATRDVLCFPVIDWHFRVQRPQHLARVLGERGHRVFYLCTQPETGAARNGFEVVESPSPNVWLVRLRLARRRVPNLYRERLEGETLADYVEAVDVLCDALGIASPVALVDLPFWRPLVESLSGSTMIYDCMDHHAGFSTNTDAMLGEEEALLEAADAVVVTSAWLQRRVEARRAVTLVRNGAEVERFVAPPTHESERATSRPIVGYLGAISDWFDVDLVACAALALPEVDFVLVGDVTHPDVSMLRSCENVRFVGEVPYAQVPAQVHGFDVCTIPFLINELTLATNPVKAYEYLAAGKPVVATAMPELIAMDGLVSIAHDADAFVACLREAISSRSDAEAAERRQAWARQHDWSRRGEAIEQVFHQCLPRVSVVVLTWNNLELTRACLDSLVRHTDYPDWELILVDNGSSDETPAYFREFALQHSRVRLALNDTNLGFAAGNNVGLRAATGEVVVLLNNDTYVTPGWLSGLVGHLRRNSDLGLVGPVTNNIGNEARIEVQYGDMTQMRRAARIWTRSHPRRLLEAEVVAFFCVAIPRAVLEEVGYLDEEFGQGFFEDDDYCRRVRNTGRRIAIAEDVFVHHHLSASFATLDRTARDALFERNKAVYERKWGKWKPHVYRKR